MAHNIRKTGATRHARYWQGPVILSYGFRPFFFGAALVATLAMLNWLALLHGAGIEPVALSPLEWHMHEMLFGYGSAAIAGFLLTAVPNWTGRLPVSGWPLLGLALLWLAGRLVLLLPFDLPGPMAAVIEAAFLPVFSALIAREVVGGRNWRNLKVLGPLAVLALANIWFHVQTRTAGGPEASLRLGFAAVVFLISLIGGRITPSFTRNWLVRQKPGPLPVPFNRFDAAVLVLTVLGLIWWVVLPEGAPWALAGLLVLAGIGQGIRLSRWQGARCRRNALLLILHVAYGFIPLGLLMLAAAMATDDPAHITAAFHIFGAGAIGNMTFAVMLRATLGHTGRKLWADRGMIFMLALAVLAVGLRVAAAFAADALWLIDAAGTAWIVAFGLFAFRVGPWLMRPRQTA